MGYLNTGVLSKELIPPHINFSHLSAQDYAEMYGVIKTVKEDSFGQLGLDACVLEDELNKVSGRCLKNRDCICVLKKKKKIITLKNIFI